MVVKPGSAVAGIGRAGPIDAGLALAERRVAPVSAADPAGRAVAAARCRQVARFQGRLRTADRPIEDTAGGGDDTVDREAELLEDRPGRRARTEVVERDHRALIADPAVPSERHAGLDRNPG